MQIMACTECGSRDLNAVFSHRGAFTGSYQCQECEHVDPEIAFEDMESYENFKPTLSE